MIRTILFFPVLMLFTLSAFAQAFVIGDVNTLSDHLTYKNSDNNNPGIDSYYANIDGSPYLDNEFSTGEVTMNDSLQFKNIPLRYNVLNDKMQFLDERNQIFEIDNPEQNYRYILGEHRFLSCDYSIEGEIQHGIIEELVKGKIKLYKKYSAKFKPATKAIGFQEAEPDRILRDDEIYLFAIGNAVPENIRFNKKTLFNSLEPFKKDIEQYAKKENLKLRSEEDLIRLIRYCNE